MVDESKIWIKFISIIFLLALAACGTGLVFTPDDSTPGPVIEPTGGDQDMIISPPAGKQSGSEDIIINILPEDYLTYLCYLEAINGRPGRADLGEIEGTVVSITHGEICPHQEEDCRIEPYPNDWGIVRVDRVLALTPASGEASELIIEQPAEKDEGGIASTSGSQGQDISTKEKTVPALTDDQEVTAQFVLTARPVNVRNVPGEEMVPSDGIGIREGSGEDTVEQPAKPLDTACQPLPQDKGLYTFTTKVGGVKEVVQKKLPGLEVGTRFRAEITYNGIMYIDEYEILP